MSEAIAAGWYPDPNDKSSERWWGGTDWTANTRLLIQAPAQAPPPPLPAAVALPPAGASGRLRFSHRSSNPLVGLLVGLVFLGLGPIIVFTSRTPENMSATTGTVISVPVRYSTGTSTTRSTPSCTPVAQFVVGGKTYPATMSGGSWPCPWTVGQQVGVAYDPANPYNAMIPITGITRFLPWIFTVIGALLTGVTLRAWWRRKATTA